MQTTRLPGFVPIWEPTRARITKIPTRTGLSGSGWTAREKTSGSRLRGERRGIGAGVHARPRASWWTSQPIVPPG